MTGFQFGVPSSTAVTTTPSSAALATVDLAGGNYRAVQGTMTSSVNIPSIGTSTTTGYSENHPSTSSSSSVLEIPCLEHEFPNLAVHFQLESIFESLSDGSLSSTDQMLQGQELFHLVETLRHDGDDKTRDSMNSHLLRQGYNLSKPRPFPPRGSHPPTGLQGLPTHIVLPGQSSSLPTPLPSSILKTLESISTCLQLSLAQAGALYGSCILDALDSVALGSDTASWFEKRHLRPWTAQGFVETCLEKFQRDKCYVFSHDKIQSKSSVVGATQDAMFMAMNLYFLERGCQLETILMIMQYRISALQTLLDCDKSGSTCPDSSARIILQATNQLLESGIVSNLVNLVKELTLLNEDLKKNICANLQEYDKNVNDRGHIERGFMNTVSDAKNGITANISDADYVMYEFTLEQRHLACRCLFYLMYHTQSTVEEVTDIIDLINSLTNGDKSLGMVCGLPILDPIRDVPDPYVVRWRNSDMGNEISDEVNNVTNNVQHSTSMTPQQIKATKDHRDWKEELSADLWSIRGLTQATVTTTHTDFSRQTMYHSLTLGELQNQRDVEIVDGGKPQLMQCVTVLILTVMNVFVCENDMVDRNVEDEVRIVKETVLITSCNTPTIIQVLKPLVDRLDPSSQRFTSWKRRDIVGILSASFGLLLNHMMTSGSSLVCRSGEQSELKVLLQSCLEISTTEKSITFARVSLLSCLDAVSMKTPTSSLRNDFEFYISVITDFSATYLDVICSFGDLPISRRKWLTFEEDELQLRQVQEQQRKQLEEWSGKPYYERTLPEEVDLSRRPDCIDDIIALAVSICSTYPDSSQKFWSICCTGEDGDGEGNIMYRLKPARIIKRLEKSQAKDPSLAPVYVAFMSVLALADDPNGFESGNSGADAIFDWLSNNNRFISSPTSYDATSQINWSYILLWLNWCQEQLSLPSSTKSHGGWGVNDNVGYRTSQNDGSTSYYYGSHEWDNSYKSNVIGSGAHTKEPSLNAVSEKFDLDSWTTMLLMSYLSLVSHVAVRSYRCRKELLEMKVAKSSTSHIMAKDEDIITILFNLLSKPISSETRGLTFTTIASLVRQRPDENQAIDEKKKYDDIVLKCWEFLESSQILPIFKLCQYSPLRNSVTPGFTRSQSKMEKNNWFPPDEQYGIIYEMEYVESKAGSYPSTEGFLKLLATLFSCDICPFTLGSTWRPQTGCSPYVEYVTDFVLPRILDSQRGEHKLHFASETDKSRLLARALEVVNTILIRYVPSNLPLIDDSEITSDEMMRRSIDVTKELDFTDGLCDVSRKAMKLINQSIFPKKMRLENLRQAQIDFYDESIQLSQERYDSHNQQLPPTTAPRAKSPGYYILVDLLSSNGLLFDRLTELLVVESESKTESVSAELLTVSLYGEFSPSYHLAKTGRDYIIDVQKSPISQLSIENLESDLVQNFTKDLLMVQTEDVNDDPLNKFDGTITARSQTSIWKDLCTLLALKILCAAAARADKFVTVSRSVQNRLTAIPVLRFNLRETGLANPLFIKNFRIDRLPKRLLEKICTSRSNPSGDLFLAVLFYFVGYQSSVLKSGNGIALMAMSILKYLTLSSSLRDFSSVLSGLQPSSRTNISTLLSSRLSFVALRKDDFNECSLVDELLKLILFHLRLDDWSEHNLAIVILGLSELTVEDRKKYLWKSLQGFNVDICSHINALDVILDLLATVDFMFNVKTSKLSVTCFEIIFRLCELSGKMPSDSIHICVMNKLRKSDFWKLHLLRLVGISISSDSLLGIAVFQSPLNNDSLDGEESIDIIERDNNIVQSVSWLLRGVAYELHFLMGYFVEIQNLQPHQCRQLIELLLGHKCDLLFNTLIYLPLRRPRYFSNDTTLKKPSGTCASTVTFEFNRLDDVYGECSVLDSLQHCKTFDESNITSASDEVSSRDAIRTWAILWNTYMKSAYASSHVTKSWSILCSTVFNSCRQVLLTTFNDDEPSPYNGDTALRLLKRILSLFVGHLDHGKSIIKKCYDKESLFALSISCVPLVEFIFDLYHNDIDEAEIHVSLQDITSLIKLLIDAIVACGNDGNYSDEITERIVSVFASILSFILESMLVKTKIGVNSLIPEDIFGEKAVAALLILMQLSLRSTTQLLESQHDTLHVRDMATFCSASFLYWLECVQTNAVIDQTVLFKLYEANSERSLFSKLIAVISSCKEPSVHLLQTIACCKGGADLLLELGVTEEVIKVSLHHVGEASGSRHASMLARSDCLKRISFNVTLLNTLMSVDISEHFTYRLLSGVSKFVQINLGLIEELIDQFPYNHALLHDFMITISLATSYTQEGSTIQVYQFFESSNLHSLDKIVFQFAKNVSEYPLPGFALPVLPSHLRRIAQDRSWWDKVPNILDNHSRVDASLLPNPPKNYENDCGDHPWTVHMYSCACDAASCLDISLTYLINRFSPVADLGALAVALHRCMETASAVEKRLRYLAMTNETVDSGIIQSTAFNVRENNGLAYDLARKREFDLLQTFGSSLTSCMFKLMQMTKLNIDRILDSSQGHMKIDPFDNISTSFQRILSVLKNVDVKTAAGCIGMLDNHEVLVEIFNANLHNTLIGLEKLCGGLQK